MNFNSMKKQVYLIILLLALPLFAMAQSRVKVTPFEKNAYDRLKGKPDSVVLTIYSYAVDDTDMLGELQDKQVYRTIYDKKGRIERFVFEYGFYGSTKTSLISYDKKGRATEMKYFEDDRLSDHLILKSADKKKMVYECSHLKTGKLYKQNPDSIIYTKFSKRHIQFEEYYSVSDFFYDKKGRQIKQDVYVKYDNSGERYQTLTITFEYNKQNLVVSETEDKEEGQKMERTMEYTKFDKRGNWLECVVKSTNPNDGPARYVREIYYGK